MQDRISKLTADLAHGCSLMSEEKVEVKRRQRIMAQENRERAEHQRRIDEARYKERQTAKTQREESLANALYTVKVETLRDEKYRQQIRETAPEIRELEAQLASGYMTKELKAQIASREAAHMTETENKRLTSQSMAEDRTRLAEQEREATIRKHEKSKQYQAELDDQLAEAERAKGAAYEQFLREKQIIDDIVAKIHADDAAEGESALRAKMASRKEIDEFKASQDAYRKQEEARRKEEERIASVQKAELDDRDAGEKQAKRERLEAMEKLQAEMAAKVSCNHHPIHR